MKTIRKIFIVFITVTALLFSSCQYNVVEQNEEQLTEENGRYVENYVTKVTQ